MIFDELLNILEKIGDCEKSTTRFEIAKVILFYKDDFTITIKDNKIEEEHLNDLQRDLMALMRVKKILCDEYKYNYSKGIDKAIRAIEDKILAKDNPEEDT